MSEAAELEDAAPARRKRPDEPIYVPPDANGQLRLAHDLVAKCNTSVGRRTAAARVLHMACQTGREDGDRSIVNLLPRHINRLSGLLFDPVDLRFSLHFKRRFEKEMLARGREAARTVTDDWKTDSTDELFGQGVAEGLRYGCCIFKQWPSNQDAEVVHNRDLIMPWNFGVYREDLTDLNRQPAMCHTSTYSLPEMWRMISHYPNALDLWKRIKTAARMNMIPDAVESTFHNVLSASTLNTNSVGMQQPMPGGIVQVANDSQYGIMGASVDVPLVKLHEVWVWDHSDYVVFKLVEPDILIEPSYMRQNLLAAGSGLHPFNVIRPNYKAQYFWGETELEQMLEPQGWASVTASELRRCLGAQFDKLLYFAGDQPDDEAYAAMRLQGYGGGGAGSDVKDLTPSFPTEGVPMFELILRLIDAVGGFDNILSGRGEPGVRAGSHANTLLRTASPSVRIRSLIVERQCAAAGDLWFRTLRYKDGSNYWTDPDNPKGTAFKMVDIPEAARLQVDSHSASPVFQGEFDAQMQFLVREGAIDPVSAVELATIPHKDAILERLHQREAIKEQLIAQMLKQDPASIVELVTGKKPATKR